MGKGKRMSEREQQLENAVKETILRLGITDEFVPLGVAVDLAPILRKALQEVKQ